MISDSGYNRTIVTVVRQTYSDKNMFVVPGWLDFIELLARLYRVIGQ